MESLLNKGLSFCPTPSGVNLTQLLYQMERKMAWRHFYFDASEDENENVPKEKFPFPDKKKRTNLPKEYPEEIKNICEFS